MKVRHKLRNARIESVLHVLNERERYVFDRVSMSFPPVVFADLEEVPKVFRTFTTPPTMNKVTRERIRQIHAKACRKIAAALEGKTL